MTTVAVVRFTGNGSTVADVEAEHRPDEQGAFVLVQRDPGGDGFETTRVALTRAQATALAEWILKRSAPLRASSTAGGKR